MKTICLSAGHGAGDPGVIYQGLKEETLTMTITKRAVEIIRKHGVDCLEVPDNLTLIETIQWINNRTNQIGICVEVHINSGMKEARGVEGWNYVGAPTESDKLSQYLVDACSIETGLINRGIKDESQNRFKKLGFVHDTNPVAALIECGFIQGDYDFLKNDENLTKMAKGVARGCLQYLDLPWKPELINLPTPLPQPHPDQKDQRIRQLEEELRFANELIKDLSRRPVSCPSFKTQAQQIITIANTIA